MVFSMTHIMNTQRLTLIECTLNNIAGTPPKKSTILNDIITVLSPNVVSHLPANFHGITTINNAKNWLINMLEQSRVFAVSDVHNDTTLGFIFMHNSDTNQYHIGYLFAQAHWGKGYAQEALSAFITWCKSTPNIKELIAGVEKDNLASITVLKKIGFTFHSEGLHSMRFYTRVL